MKGKTEWIIPDGFMSDTKSETYVSHEAVCVLNLNEQPARVELEIYFEDREPLLGFSAICEGKRCNHIRLDKIKNADGNEIPHEVPYAIYVKSDIPVVVQHSRMDVTQPNMTLMTTIAY
ncbi:MAG: hypothetical protein IK057_00485 [Clostridia bacterium]|nr:hypothetical protein [Clostridia bacterium]